MMLIDIILGTKTLVSSEINNVELPLRDSTVHMLDRSDKNCL